MARIYWRISSVVTAPVDTTLSIRLSVETSSSRDLRLIFATTLQQSPDCLAALSAMRMLASSRPVMATKASVWLIPSSLRSSLSVPSPTITSARGSFSLISTHRCSFWSMIFTDMPISSSSDAR